MGEYQDKQYEDSDYAKMRRGEVRDRILFLIFAILASIAAISGLVYGSVEFLKWCCP